MITPIVQPEFLDVDGAKAFTSLSRRTLDYAKARGDLPFIRAGGKILFRRADLIDWLERGRVDVRADVARMEAAASMRAGKGG
jgi:excisionase family DNA binding protein